MKRRGWLLVLVGAIACSGLLLTGMSVPSRYDTMMAAILHDIRAELSVLPNGKPLQLPDHYAYPDNYGSRSLRAITTMEGYLAQPKDGSRVGEKLMTYRQFVSTLPNPAINHNISPNRMVWVWEDQVPNGIRIHRPDGGWRLLPNARRISFADAETGRYLGTAMMSGDGTWIDEPPGSADPGAER